ncbi:MAG: RecQ family ATP-dependent DNA helicase [Ktedonobacteraceae bacterium]
MPSAIVSSDFDDEENRKTLNRAIAGAYKILFIAPERLDNVDWQENVIRMRISMIVIDEAHCISTWGHDFRPHYRRIVRLLDAVPQKTPILALTATANEHVEEDILQQVHAAQVIRGTMQRPNLALNVVATNGDKQKLSYLAEVLPHLTGTGIIYTATKSNAEMVATFLSTQGIQAAYYHAGLNDDVRQAVEQQWMQNEYRVVCSTNALGMGIDKPDIRFVIHYNIPSSPIHYYQEIGRAGRDGQYSQCILLYDAEDLAIQKHFIESGKPDGKSYTTVLSFIRNSLQKVRQKDILLATGVSQTAVRTILADLTEQHFIARDTREPLYTATNRLQKVDFSGYDSVLQQKREELSDITNYAISQRCYAEYLTTYLGDRPGYTCGVCGCCRPDLFPLLIPTERIQRAVVQFLEKDFLPRIQKKGTEARPVHEAGWSLSYHGSSRIGALVRRSKYENAGPFADELVSLAVDVIRRYYPIQTISGIVSVPPTKSGKLVEEFARRVAAMLQVEYMSVLVKVHTTSEQKNFKNSEQKKNNVKNAFSVISPRLIADQNILLIDDIYDSGYILREVAQTLMNAGVLTVYPFTITRTLHSDDQ